MEQPANSSCFWLGLCLVVRYSIDFLSLVPLPSLCRYAPVLSIHSQRKGGGEREGSESNGWCLCDDTDPIRSHGKDVEHTVPRQPSGIEFARLRLQDEPWIWFLCYTSICYHISRRLRVFVCVCILVWVYNMSGLARNLNTNRCLCVPVGASVCVSGQIECDLVCVLTLSPWFKSQYGAVSSFVWRPFRGNISLDPSQPQSSSSLLVS